MYIPFVRSTDIELVAPRNKFERRKMVCFANRLFRIRLLAEILSRKELFH
jgi:hypothetical protein